MAGYNGHKNWNHWNVSLWLNNDEGLYRMALEYTRRARTLDAAARRLMGVLEGEKTPDGAPFSYSSVRAALRGIQA